MCPVCETTLDQSSSPAAQQIKRVIATRIAAGDTKTQIKDRLVAEYGSAILAAPPHKGFGLVAWWLPVAGILAAAVAVGVGARRWARAREPAPAGPPLDAASEQRLGDPGVGRRVALASLPFIAGFAIVFVALGAAANLIAGVLNDQTRQALAGFILVVAGLAFMGLLPGTDRLVAGGVIQGARKSGSRVLLGGAFAICAAPCVGPFLAEAFAAAGNSDTVIRGSAWLAAYSAGLGAAFLLVAVFFVRGMTLFRWMRDHYRVFSIVGGTILVLLGLLLFFDEFYRVQVYTHRLLEAVGLGDL